MTNEQVPSSFAVVRMDDSDLDIPAVAEPKFEKGQEYAVAPSPQGARPIPKFSRRAQLAAQITHADNVALP